MNKAKHYNNHPSKVEAKEVIRHLPFQLGNIFKYIYIRNDKITHDKDCKKALDYIEWELEEPSYKRTSQISAEVYLKLNKIIENENNYEAKWFYIHFRDYVVDFNKIKLELMIEDINNLLKTGE